MNKPRFTKILGKNIRNLRESKKMTQEQVAASGIDVKQYQRIERGLVNPTAYTLYLLSRVLECNLDELMPD
ncbi:MAG: helix-turn-helix transcriptional regulator [Deltaproteobacteria bacterium]|nr:helix-turn-helix transcriptional regulator [Deltaproteobacteria bacterium]